MVCPGVREVAYAQLMDATQPLDFRTVEQSQQPTIPGLINAYVVVKRIAEDLVGHGIPCNAASMNRLDVVLCGVHLFREPPQPTAPSDSSCRSTFLNSQARQRNFGLVPVR